MKYQALKSCQRRPHDILK